MWIRRSFVNDLIEIKEACSGNAFLSEALKTGAFLGIIGEEPCCA